MVQPSPLSCDEALRILRETPLHASVLFGNVRVIAALNHYHACRQCLMLGLAAIVNRRLRCEEAIRAYLASQNPNTASSLVQGMIWGDLVTEHIWGREICLNPESVRYERKLELVTPRCGNSVCQAVVAHWDLGGWERTIAPDMYLEHLRNLPPKIRPLMVAQGWSTEELTRLSSSWNT